MPARHLPGRCTNLLLIKKSITDQRKRTKRESTKKIIGGGGGRGGCPRSNRRHGRNTNTHTHTHTHTHRRACARAHTHTQVAFVAVRGRGNRDKHQVMSIQFLHKIWVSCLMAHKYVSEAFARTRVKFPSKLWMSSWGFWAWTKARMENRSWSRRWTR